MSEETIIKALEICPTSSCARCPLRKRVDCRNFLLKEALKLIRSKAEELNQAIEQQKAAERNAINTLNEIKELMEQANKGDHPEAGADHEEIHGL